MDISFLKKKKSDGYFFSKRKRKRDRCILFN